MFIVLERASRTVLEEMSDATNNAVLVRNLSPEVTKQTLLDFFSFCGEISAVKIRPSVGEGGSSSSGSPTEAMEALVIFENQSAKKTALVLDSATLKKRKISVMDATEELVSSFKDVREVDLARDSTDVPETATARQERLQGLREEFDRAIKRASDKLSDFNEKHRITEKVQEFGDLTKRKTQEINEQYRLTERAREGWQTVREKTRELDERLHLSESARDGWRSLKASVSKIMQKDRGGEVDKA